jgi:hypothetical protein
MRISSSSYLTQFVSLVTYLQTPLDFILVVTAIQHQFHENDTLTHAVVLQVTLSGQGSGSPQCSKA